MANIGKIFEQNFKRSIPNNCFYYRFKDGTANWNPLDNSNVRFQSHNIADALLFYNRNLFICELKSHKGKSLPINCIRTTQLKEMLDSAKYPYIFPYIFVYFSDISKCYASNIKDISNFINSSDRKSIPLEFFINNAIEVQVIPLRTQFKLDLETFLTSF